MKYKRVWQMEYYNGDQRVRFTLLAKTFNSAIEKGDLQMKGFRRTATYEIN